jgi:L-iditol 2-dehydrogenase
MKAFRMHGVAAGAVETVADPRPDSGDVVIEPLLSGVCSTDVHVYLEGALDAPLPVTLGHEVVGRVVAAPESREWAPYAANPGPLGEGDMVCVEPLLPCGGCHQCLRGRPNLCARQTHLGISRDGCFADLVSVPALRATALPEALVPDVAIFVEPLACALHFVDKAGVGPGMSLLVLGAGPAGLLTVQAAAIAGVDVIVSEMSASRRAHALRLGARVAIDPGSDDLGAAVLDATAGLGPDAVIEVTGNPDAVGQAIDVAPSGSTVVLAGICGQKRTLVDTNAVVRREITVTGALASRWHFGRAIALLRDGRIRVDGMVSRREHWTRADEVLRTAAVDRDVCKILLTHAV